MASLAVRALREDDLEPVVALGRRVFDEEEDMTGWARHHLEAHLEAFPEGQLVVELDGRVRASSSSLIVDAGEVETPHTWMSITGGCELPNHDPDGDLLYGLEIVVHPEDRGLGLARLLYRSRKVLARHLGLEGIAIAGRLAGYRTARRTSPGLTPQRYVEQVWTGARDDPVLGVQRAAGFAPRRVLENYVVDPQAEHRAVLATWEA